MRKLLFVSIFLGWTFMGAGAPGAQPLEGKSEFTVEGLVTQALAQNPEIQAMRAEVEAAGGRLRQAGLRPNPMLEFSGQKSVYSPDNNVGVGVTIPLDLNGRLEGRVGVAEREAEMKRKQLSDKERKMRAEVRMKAGEVLAARRNLRFTEELLQANRRAQGVLGERVRKGAAPSLEESLLQVEVNRLEASRRILRSRVEIATLQLKTLAGMAPESPLALNGSLSNLPPALERKEVPNAEIEARPDVALARTETELARAKIEKEKAEGKWDASFNVGYQRMKSGFNLMGLTEAGAMRDIEDTFHFVGVGLTIMLPFRNQNQGNIAAAMAEAKSAERRLAYARLTARQEVAASLAQYEAAKRSLEIYQGGVWEIARRNLDVVWKTYELGRTSLLDAIAEQRRYIEVEMGLTDALKQIFDAATEIERAHAGAAR